MPISPSPPAALSAEARREQLERSFEAGRHHSEQHAATIRAGRDPFREGSAAGFSSGSAAAALASTAIFGLGRLAPASRISRMAPGGKAWLVCIAGMAGFFTSSEFAVVGSSSAGTSRGGECEVAL